MPRGVKVLWPRYVAQDAIYHWFLAVVDETYQFQMMFSKPDVGEQVTMAFDAVHWWQSNVRDRSRSSEPPDETSLTWAAVVRSSLLNLGGPTRNH